LKILLLNYEFPPIGGGAGKASLCLLKEYAKRDDITVDVLTSKPGRGFEKEIFSDNITIYKVGIAKKNLHYWRKLEVIEWLLRARKYYRKLIYENEYDVAHAFFGFPTGWLCLKHRDRVPYIISLRGSDVPGYNVRLGLDYKLLSGLFKKIWSNASAVIANSKGLSELGAKFMPDLDIDVIHNGIYLDSFFPLAEKKTSSPLKLLTVCRLISRKRIDLLIGAVAEGKNRGVDMHLNIAGDGNLLDQLRRVAVSLDVVDRVSFLGRVESEAMGDVYRENDIYVMSSAHEGMSNSMLEAMASGLPIVTTKCEGVEELIDGNGIVVDSVDAAAICEAITQITVDPSVYYKMRECSRCKAMSFSWQGAADSYLAKYQQLKK
jgi:glycosyltransferase involved in cell wall biosynthesis